MAGDKRSGGGDEALTNLARRGRGDKVGRNLKPSRRRHHRRGSAVAAGPTYPLFVNTEEIIFFIVVKMSPQKSLREISHGLPGGTNFFWLPSPSRIILEEPISSGYPAHLGLIWRNQFLLVTQPT